MKAKRIPPGRTEPGRNGGGYGFSTIVDYTTSVEKMQAEISAAAGKEVTV